MNKTLEEEMKKLYPGLTDEECRDATNQLVDFFYQAAKILNETEEETTNDYDEG